MAGGVTFPACLPTEGREGLSQAGMGPSRVFFFLWTVQRGLGPQELPLRLRVGRQNTLHSRSTKLAPGEPLAHLGASSQGDAKATLPLLVWSSWGKKPEAMVGREGQGRVWKGAPSGSAPLIFTTWSSELPSEALAPVEGGVPPGRASVGDRPLRNGAGCFVWGFRSFPRRPGRDGGGRQFCCILSFCPLLGRVRFACFFLLDCWCTAPLRPLPRALRELGCFGGPAGVPGLEKRRAEWLTTSNFCFSVGLGWAGLGDIFSTSQNFFSPRLRNLFFSFCHFFCRSYQRNQD